MTATILVIDDDAGLRRALAKALQSAGYQVLTARDGEEALVAYAQQTPAAIICDIMMPNMDGITVFRTLRMQLQAQNIPMLIATALPRQAWFADLEDEGAVFLSKPLNMALLLQILSDTLS